MREKITKLGAVASSFTSNSPHDRATDRLGRQRGSRYVSDLGRSPASYRASLHTPGNTPPAAQTVIFRPAARPGQHSHVRHRCSHPETPVTEFAPEPITLASDTAPYPRQLPAAR